MNETKRQNFPPADLPPGLWVVATPIGNLRDLTLRARDALIHAERIYCEDTRRTSRLMAALGIEGRLERLDAHSSPDRIRRVASELKELQEQGRGGALVTDAGTPAISDPGARLVAEARTQGVRITPVPGCSAVTATLSIAGWESTHFSFRGFFPRKAGDRARELAEVGQYSGTFVWFESPERISDSLKAVAEAQAEAPVFVAKEVSKVHEKFFSGTAAEVCSEVQEELAREGCVGEWVFSLSLNGVSEKNSDWKKAVECCIDAGVSASVAAKQVSHFFGVAKNEVYAFAVLINSKKK